jgi:hypothetical protein
LAAEYPALPGPPRRQFRRSAKTAGRRKLAGIPAVVLRLDELDGAPLVNAFDLVLGEYWTSYVRMNEAANARIQPVLDIFLNGIASVSGVMENSTTGGWADAQRVQISHSFWRHARFLIRRDSGILFELTRKKTIAYDCPLISLSNITTLSSNFLTKARSSPTYGEKTIHAKQFIQGHRPVLKDLSKRKAAAMIAGAVGCSPSLAKRALNDDGM